MQMIRNRGDDYESVIFYTLWQEFQKNQQELISQGIILEGFDRYHYTDNPHYSDNPHYQDKLDPTFDPWRIT